MHINYVLYSTVLILVILYTVVELNDCANLQEETCALCLIKPGCAWCSDEVCKVLHFQ